MKTDLASVVKKVAEFLGKTIPEGEDLKRIVEFLSFDKMRNNPASNKKHLVKVKQIKCLCEKKSKFQSKMPSSVH